MTHLPDTFIGRARRAWSAFFNRDPPIDTGGYGGTSWKPDRVRLTRGADRSIITAIYNRIAMDVAGLDFMHVQLDEEGRFKDKVKSPLMRCLELESNIDQLGRSMIQDAVMTMLDEGCAAIMPTRTNIDPNLAEPGSFEVNELRVGRISSWFPNAVRVNIYDDTRGEKRDILMKKRAVAIVENPLYATMNEPNSVVQRLSRKLALLDAVDEQSSSGKLDLIIQLPYVVKSPARKAQAEQRRTELESQLSGSKYGIAYTDGTEKIVQLNRSLENNLLKQIEFLTAEAYSQLGLTQEILNGTADDAAMTNYYNRTIEPFAAAIAGEMRRKFLSEDARESGQTVTFFHDPFKLIPVSQIAEMSDKLTRNEIMTSNEVRGKIGLKPSSDPKADKLENKNLNHEGGGGASDDEK